VPWMPARARTATPVAAIAVVRWGMRRRVPPLREANIYRVTTLSELDIG